MGLRREVIGSTIDWTHGSKATGSHDSIARRSKNLYKNRSCVQPGHVYSVDRRKIRRVEASCARRGCVRRPAGVQDEVTFQNSGNPIVIIVAFVETRVMQTIHPFFRPFNDNAIQGFQSDGLVVRVGCSHDDRQRAPRRSVNTLRLVPRFLLSTGLGPVASPPKGALVIAPSRACHFQSIPTALS